MALAITMPVQQLRLFGFSMALTGFAMIWIISNF